MSKKFKKILATVSAVAMCATSVISMGAGAIAVFKDRVVNPETTSFSATIYNRNCNFRLWQEATDYFDDEDIKIYISDTLVNDNGEGYTYELISRHIHYYDTLAEKWIDYCSIGLLGGCDAYRFDTEDDTVNFEKYLSDNNIEYTTEKCSDDMYEVYVEYYDITSAEYIAILQKIKDDTGYVADWVSPESMVTITETENTLPEPTLMGDTNCDGEVNISDAVLLMQSITNPSEFQISIQGMANADVTGDDGITLLDALRIQEMQVGK